jgi:DNA-binding NarL/FixJ family response regulator
MDYLKELDDIKREIAIVRNRMRDWEARVNDLYKQLHSIKGAEDILTKREFEVFLLVKKGLADDEIASQLYLCQSTVEGYLYSSLNKLGCKKRAELLQID